MKCKRCLTVGFLLAMACGTSAVDRGEVVVVKQDADMRLSGKSVGKVKAGDVLKVHAVRGAWVEVGNKTKGWIRTENVTSQQNAIDHVTELLKERPDDARLLVTRARMYLAAKAHDAAELDLHEAIRTDPANAEARYFLSRIHAQDQDPVKALSEVTEAIKLQDDDARFYELRGKLYQRQRDFKNSIQDYEKVVQLGEADPVTYNILAWWYATSLDASIRNGPRAVKYALQACELSHYDSFMYVDTLAAAYAEYNDFTNAVKWQEEAVKLAYESQFRAEAEARLKQYRLNQPYREAMK